MQIKSPSHPLGCLEWFKWNKKKSKINVDTDVEKFGPSYTAGGNLNWAATMENSLEVLQKLNRVPHDPAIPLLVINKIIEIAYPHAEAPKLWPLDAKSWFIGKDSDAGKDWRQKQKREAKD